MWLDRLLTIWLFGLHTGISSCDWLCGLQGASRSMRLPLWIKSRMRKFEKKNIYTKWGQKWISSSIQFYWIVLTEFSEVCLVRRFWKLETKWVSRTSHGHSPLLPNISTFQLNRRYYYVSNLQQVSFNNKVLQSVFNLWYCVKVVFMSSLATSSSSTIFSSVTLGMRWTTWSCISIHVEYNCYWQGQKKTQSGTVHFDLHSYTWRDRKY